MSENIHLFPEMSNSREEIDCLFPEINSSIVESAHLFPEMSNFREEIAYLFPETSSPIDDSAHLFLGMDSRLYIAAEEGDVNEFSNCSVRLNIFQAFTGLGNGVLHIALTRGGNPQFIEKLLEEIKNDLNAGREFLRAKNSNGNTALHLAALHGHHKWVEELVHLMEDVEAGNFLRFQNREGNTALHEAAKGGSYEVVAKLLEHGRHHHLTSVSNRKGETALFIASQSGRTVIVEKLLSVVEPNSNMKRADGQTPLHSAVYYGHPGVVEKLLQHSPDLAKQTDGCGRTAMHILVLYFPVSPSIRLSSTRGRYFIEMARLLLEKDNSVCYKEDQKKQIPLHMAVEGLRYDLVNILLRYGRDCIEAVDNDGRKPLHLAVINAVRLSETLNIDEFKQFKNMLLSLMSRESLNHRDNTGRTPIHIAMENGKKDALLYDSIIEALDTNGALLTPEIFEDIRKMELSPATSSFKAENVSINAVLIATVSFAAVFTLPGGLTQTGEKPKAVYINALLFKLFLICDTLAFCTSIASAILVQYACVGDQQDLSLFSHSVDLFWSALISLLIAFGAAVHIVIAPSPWLAGIVWTLVSLVPFIIQAARVRSKLFIFVPRKHKFFTVLLVPVYGISSIFSTIWEILSVFLFTDLFYKVAHWIKKLLKRQC